MAATNDSDTEIISILKVMRFFVFKANDEMEASGEEVPFTFKRKKRSKPIDVVLMVELVQQDQDIGINL